MQAARIVDRGRHARRLQGCGHLIAIAELDGVLGPDGARGIVDLRGFDQIGQARVVALGHMLALLDLLGEDRKFRQQDRGLKAVQPRIDSDPDIVVAMQPLAVRAERTQQLRSFAIGGEDRAPVAIATQRLRGEKARGGDGPEIADATVAQAGTETLRRIRDHDQIMRGRGLLDGRIVRRKAEEIDRHDRARAIAPRLGHPGGGCHAARVDVAAIGKNVAEDRYRAGDDDGLRRGGEAEGRHDHGIAGAHAHRAQGEAQGVGAVGAGDHVRGMAELSQGPLQLRHLGAHDELAMGEDALHAIVDHAPQPTALRLQVDKRNRLAQAGALGHVVHRVGSAVVHAVAG